MTALLILLYWMELKERRPGSCARIFAVIENTLNGKFANICVRYHSQYLESEWETDETHTNTKVSREVCCVVQVDVANSRGTLLYGALTFNMNKGLPGLPPTASSHECLLWLHVRPKLHKKWEVCKGPMGQSLCWKTSWINSLTR